MFKIIASPPQSQVFRLLQEKYDAMCGLSTFTNCEKYQSSVHPFLKLDIQTIKIIYCMSHLSEENLNKIAVPDQQFCYECLEFVTDSYFIQDHDEYICSSCKSIVLDKICDAIKSIFVSVSKNELKNFFIDIKADNKLFELSQMIECVMCRQIPTHKRTYTTEGICICHECAKTINDSEQHA